MQDVYYEKLAHHLVKCQLAHTSLASSKWGGVVALLRSSNCDTEDALLRITHYLIDQPNQGLLLQVSTPYGAYTLRTPTLTYALAVCTSQDYVSP